MHLTRKVCTQFGYTNFESRPLDLRKNIYSSSSLTSSNLTLEHPFRRASDIGRSVQLHPALSFHGGGSFPRVYRNTVLEPATRTLSMEGQIRFARTWLLFSWMRRLQSVLIRTMYTTVLVSLPNISTSIELVSNMRASHLIPPLIVVSIPSCSLWHMNQFLIS